MAQNTTLIEDAIRIAGSVRSLYERKGWETGSYKIFMRVNLSWNTFSLGVASEHFETERFDQVDDRFYVELIDHLRTDLSEDPGLSESTSIHLCRFDDEAGLSTFSFPILDKDEVEIDFALLNPGVDDPRTPIIRGRSRGGN